MIKPTALSEQMLFSTIRLETNNGCGTGFFFLFTAENGMQLPIVITNKHVVNNRQEESVTFYLHEKINNVPGLELFKITQTLSWIFHEEYDLCFAYIWPLITKMKNDLSKDLFFKSMTENHILNDEKLYDLNAVEDIVMIGYPNGLWDEVNGMPLIRKGITAIHPALDFKGKSIGVIDCACFPGSSGSPIFILNEGAYTTKQGLYAGTRVIFLGVLFSGPQISAHGQIINVEIPVSCEQIVKTPLMMNLGYYVKAKEIIKMRETAIRQA